MKATLLIICCLLATFTTNVQAQTPRAVATRELSAKGLDAGDANAFIAAIKRGDLPTTKLFLDAGMSPDALNDDGTLAVAWAIRKNNDAIFDELLQRGANVNATEEKGDTPLMIAATSGRLRFAQTLLTKGANVNAEDNGGHTVLMSAAMGAFVKNAPDTVKRIFTDDDEESREVLVSLGDEHLAVMRFLLDNEARVDIVADDCGNTALTFAATGADIEAVKLLLARGASAKLGTNQYIRQLIREPEQAIRGIEKDASAPEDVKQPVISWIRQTLKQRQEIARLLKNASG